MTEIDALKYGLQKSEDAFNKLHKKYITLLKQQGDLERENEQLKQQNKYNEEFIVDVMADCKRLEKENEELKSNCKNYEWYKQYKQLLNENEQLKTQLQNTSAQRDEFGRGARENANRVGKLKKENEQLKQFQTNVFTLINEMIETANLYRTPIKTLDYGDDLGYWNGVYQKLKELRDILENEETRR